MFVSSSLVLAFPRSEESPDTLAVATTAMITIAAMTSINEKPFRFLAAKFMLLITSIPLSYIEKKWCLNGVKPSIKGKLRRESRYAMSAFPTNKKEAVAFSSHNARCKSCRYFGLAVFAEVRELFSRLPYNVATCSVAHCRQQVATVLYYEQYHGSNAVPENTNELFVSRLSIS